MKNFPILIIFLYLSSDVMNKGNMVFYSPVNKKGMKFTSNFFLFVLLLIFFLFGFFSFSHHTDPNSLNNTEVITKNRTKKIEWQINNAQDTIWKISNNIHTYGTTFAISPRLIITNLHILESMLTNKNSIQDIVLYKNEVPSHLKIKRVVAVSALYDLALLEIEEDVTNYLSINENSIQSNEDLTVIGYPDFHFKKMKKIGKLVDHNFFYVFPVNYFHIPGASGSPVLNQKNQVEGIVTLSSSNILYVIKSTYLKRFISGDVGLNCFNFIHPKVCLNEVTKNLKNLAIQGNVFAQFQIASRVLDEKKDMKLATQAFYWMKKATEQNFAPAQYVLAIMYYYGKGTQMDKQLALKWMKKAAEQGNIQAQHKLGEMYYKGEGTEKNLKLAFDLVKIPAEQGYIPAQYLLAVMNYEGGRNREKSQVGL